MKDQEIKPHKITKPIQLLSAWLVGLILLNASFLGTAVSLENATYLKDVLIFGSILNVPIFIIAVFLLQTRYRPEMQEDLFYSQYLDRKTNQIVSANKFDVITMKIDQIESLLRQQSSFLTVSGNYARTLEIEVNDHFPKLDSVRSLFKELDLKISDYFGAIYDSKDVPDVWIISIDKYVKLSEIAPLIRGLYHIGYNYYAIHEDQETDVFVGSYGEADGELDDEIVSNLGIWDVTDLIYYSYQKVKS